jgi:stage II sporulation protein R
MRTWLKNESKLLAVSFGVGLLFAVAVAAYTFVYSETTQRDISDNVIRFHVRANSDSEYDQIIKDYVSLKLLARFGSEVSGNTDIEETRRQLTEMLPQMQQHAEEILQNAGFDHVVTAEMNTAFFPTKVYGNIAFPPGNYEAVQITIGNGEGQNWWCLMFPPLCYVDMTATQNAQQQLSNTVSEEGFRLLMHTEDPTPELVVRFRVVEWWQNLRTPAAPAPAQNEQLARN